MEITFFAAHGVELSASQSLHLTPIKLEQGRMVVQREKKV